MLPLATAAVAVAVVGVALQTLLTQICGGAAGCAARTGALTVTASASAEAAAATMNGGHLYGITVSLWFSRRTVIAQESNGQRVEYLRHVCHLRHRQPSARVTAAS
jgi:hypothetical protein